MVKTQRVQRALLNLYVRTTQGSREGNPYMHQELREAIRVLGDPQGYELPAKPPRGTVQRALYNLALWYTRSGREGNPHTVSEVTDANRALGGDGFTSPKELRGAMRRNPDDEEEEGEESEEMEDLRLEVSQLVTDAMEEMANDSYAQAKGTFYEGLPDYVFSDTEEELWDAADYIVVARCGDAVTINGDVLVDPNWFKTLGFGSQNAVSLWRDRRDVLKSLQEWLEEEGYEIAHQDDGKFEEATEEVDREQLTRNVIERAKAVAKGSEMQLVTELAEEVIGDAPGTEESVYVSPDPCEVEFWVKRKPRVYLAFQYVVTDSDDYGHQHWAVVGGKDREEALEQFVNAVEDFSEEIWTSEAIEKAAGSSVERSEGKNTPVENQMWYQLWTDYEAALSPEELKQAQETEEWPDIDSSSEAVSISSEIKEFKSMDEAVAYVEEKSYHPPTFQAESEIEG